MHQLTEIRASKPHNQKPLNRWVIKIGRIASRLKPFKRPKIPQNQNPNQELGHGRIEKTAKHENDSENDITNQKGQQNKMKTKRTKSKQKQSKN